MKTSKYSVKISVVVLMAIISWGAVAAAKDEPNGSPFQTLQNQVDALQSQVDLLLNVMENSNATIEIDVYCQNGETIMEALESVSAAPNPVVVTVHGTCGEIVQFRRDDVTLRGATPTDGITTFGYALNAVNGASRIFVNDMTISISQGWGIGCFNQSTLRADNVSIQGGAWGVFAWDDGSCRIQNSSISGAQYGVLIGTSSHADIDGTIIKNSTADGVRVVTGGSASIRVNTDINNNSGDGISVSSGGTVNVRAVSITNNGRNGINMARGASGRIEGLGGNVTISGNARNGILLDAMSAMEIFNTAISVSNNDRYGIRCHELVGLIVFPPISFSNNGLGDNDGCVLPPVVIDPD